MAEDALASHVIKWIASSWLVQWSTAESHQRTLFTKGQHGEVKKRKSRREEEKKRREAKESTERKKKKHGPTTLRLSQVFCFSPSPTQQVHPEINSQPSYGVQRTENRVQKTEDRRQNTPYRLLEELKIESHKEVHLQPEQITSQPQEPRHVNCVGLVSRIIIRSGETDSL